MPIGPRTLRGVRALALIGGTEILGKVATLTLVVLAARMLGVERYGVFAYGLGLGQLAATLALAGFNVTLIQRGSARPEQLAGLLAQVLLLRLLLSATLLGGCLLTVLATRSDPAERTAIMMMVSACFLNVFADAFHAACTAREKQAAPAVLLAVQRMIAAALVAAALVTGFGVQGASLGYLAASAIGLVSMTLVNQRLGVAPDFGSVSQRSLLLLLKETWPAGIQTMVSTSLMRIDIIILAALAGDGAVGVYSAVYRLLETVLFLGWSVNRVVFPIMASSEELWRVRLGMRRGTSLLCFFLIPYAVLLFARGGDILDLLYGEEFVNRGAPIVIWLAIAPLFAALGYLSSNSLFVRGRDLRPVIASAIALAANLALNFTLIPRLGGTGAAVATTISYVIQAGIAYTFLWRWVGRIISVAGVGVPLSSCALVAAVLMLPWHILLVAPLSAMTYVAAWYLLSRRFDPEQVDLLHGVLPGRGQR